MGKRQKVLLLCLTAVFVCFIGTSSAFAQNGLVGPVGVVSDFLFRPVQSVFSHIRESVTAWFGNVTEAETYRAENERLKRELALYQSKERQETALEQENERLRALLELQQEKQDFLPVACRVIARQNIGITDAFRIDKGAKDGIAQEDTVISVDGLVGRISAVYQHSAVVMPYTEAGSNTAVRTVRSQAVGVAESTKEGVTYTVFSDRQPIQGDAVETSGLGGVYPSGISVGTVSDVTEQGIQITPSVNFRTLCEILVLCRGEQERGLE